MDDEIMLSGYCRATDRSRIVLAELNGSNIDADCSYPDCPHSPACQIAQQLSQLQKEAI